MITLVLLVLSLLGCGNGPGCVDETGYEDCTGTDDGSPATDTLGDAQSPSEAAADGLWYTSDVPLGGAPVEVVILAAPGLLPEATSVDVTVNDGSVVQVPVMAGGFVASVVAGLGDVVTVDPDLGETIALVLQDDLADRPPAEDDAAGGTGGTDGSIRSVDGRVDVGDGALPFVAPPYLAWIEGRPSVATIQRGDEDSLPADPGEQLCVARLEGDRAGLRSCVTL